MNTQKLRGSFVLVILVLSISIWFTPASVPQAAAASAQAATNYKALSGQHQITGPQQVLILLVDFQDVKHSMTSDQMKSLAIDGMNKYYSEVSYGKASITGEVYGWYTVSQTMSYYGRDRREPGQDVNLISLAEDATALLPSSLDIGAFKFLMIVHAGLDQAADKSTSLSGEIWSQTSCSTFPDYSPTQPVMVRSKSFQCVTFLSEFDGLGAFVHETGHLLGLPDLYDASTSDSYVGYWSLMDAGAFCCGAKDDQTPSYIGAWGAIVLGWITPSIPDPNTLVSSFSLNPLEAPGASAILIPISSTRYYIVEYRQKIGADANLPNSGVVVSYVDETLDSGRGIVKLVNPNSGALFPRQARPERLDIAAFTVGSTFRDSANDIFLAFQSSDSTVTAIYSTQELTGSLSTSNLKPSETSFSGSYDQRIALAGTLTNGNGTLIASQPVQLEIFNSTTGQWQIMGTEVTDRQGAISFQIDLNYSVGDYRARFFYAGGKAGDASYYPTSTEFNVSIKPAKITMTILAPRISTTDDVPVVISVVDANGKPLADVSIAIYVDKVQRAVVQSDGNGLAKAVLALGLNEAGSHTIAAEAKSTNYTSPQTSVSLLTIPPIWLIALLLIATLAGIAAVGLVILEHQNRKYSLPAGSST